MNYPGNLLYSKEHEWAKVDGDLATIGITWFAQDALGDVVFVELPKVGAELKQMDEFGVVESIKTVSTLYSPVSGKVIEINQELAKHPELVNTSPYDNGWIIKVKISNQEELKNLLSQNNYEALL
ncbi:MAG: glycine cleavage system H protein [Candidatus Saganbacteria bacterium]|uniref:Glycine cleavage system H protein n=1 Tax=Candidatus Saganbacteria bacterium TaxID=2575572 RepID=A0A833L4P7_UNCSA|nr:MAG: glycine cleavage system H protein [Candidatus Saganbacteria bacterium]